MPSPKGNYQQQDLEKPKKCRDLKKFEFKSEVQAKCAC